MSETQSEGETECERERQSVETNHGRHRGIGGRREPHTPEGSSSRLSLSGNKTRQVSSCALSTPSRDRKNATDNKENSKCSEVKIQRDKKRGEGDREGREIERKLGRKVKWLVTFS